MKTALSDRDTWRIGSEVVQRPATDRLMDRVTIVQIPSVSVTWACD